MKKILLQTWLSRGWLACLLWPLSQVYGFLFSARRHLYKVGLFKSTRVGVPVIVVGNVIAGGAGKTPLVMALVQHLQNHGLKVGVLSRGYGRIDTACREVHENTPISESGDEPALIRRATGATVFVAARRAEAAMALIQAYPETQVLVCDDGLQHYALARDIEIAVFDDRGTGNGWTLPAGPLREPWPARLHEIDLVLHSGQNPAFEGFSASRRLSAYALAANGTRVLLSSLQGKPLLALAAIARPQAFFDMLTACGLTLGQTISLPDHDDFSGYALPASDGVTVLCTEKDAVKLFGLKSMESVNLLAVPLEFSPEPAFMAAVDTLLAPLLSSRLISQLPSSHGH
ncbi:MAG: tetraacyldisaccharide 4'-kinase [Polaromonas sp.]|nr:tetraacyldisaccharide 4'-kinase [Polaromonas sp.]